MKNKHAVFIIFSTQTLLFGLFLLFHQGIYLIDSNNDITSVLTKNWIGIVLLVVGILGFVGVRLENAKVIRIVLVLMQFFWSFFTAAFFIRELQGDPNTDWILTLGEVFTLLYLAKKE